MTVVVINQAALECAQLRTIFFSLVSNEGQTPLECIVSVKESKLH
jgi:hypothetical protein